MQIGVNNAVNTIKNIDIPSTANIEGPKIGSKLKIQSNFIIAWNWPSPSKEAHKRIVAVNVNNDHSNPIFHKRSILSLDVINNKHTPIKGNINIKYNIFLLLHQRNGTWTHNLLLPKQTIYHWYTLCGPPTTPE